MTLRRARNPYKVFERIVAVLVYVIVIAVVALSLSVVIYAIGSWLSEDVGWGWWSLLVIPALPVGLILIGLIEGLFRWVTDAIAARWRKAKWNWEHAHAPDGPVVPTGTEADQ